MQGRENPIAGPSSGGAYYSYNPMYPMTGPSSSGGYYQYNPATMNHPSDAPFPSTDESRPRADLDGSSMDSGPLSYRGYHTYEPSWAVPNQPRNTHN